MTNSMAGIRPNQMRIYNANVCHTLHVRIGRFDSLLSFPRVLLCQSQEIGALTPTFNQVSENNSTAHLARELNE